MTRTLLALAVSLCLASFAAAQAGAASDERILSFRSDIEVHADATMTVTETIVVRAARNQIKRGIYREFPTTYQDRFGNTVRVGFHVLSVTRDGRTEPYHIRDASNGKRVYIGDKDVILKPGRYSYTLTYTTNQQIGFFEDFDELYWNVTGNGWAFPIDQAEARVTLPKGALVLDTFGYTGYQGAKGADYTMRQAASGAIIFTATRPLKREEGMTIVVSWPKGVVTEPGIADKARNLLVANMSVLAGGIGLLVLVAYYCAAWLKVGRDPDKGTIVPLFEPPEDFSPAATRYVMRMGYDHKAFTAAIVSMAVKGYLTIVEDADDEYTLKRTVADRSVLTVGEAKLGMKLFGSKDSIVLDQINHKKIKGALKALKGYLGEEFEAKHFERNLAYFIVGIAITVLTLGAIVIGAPRPDEAAFMTIWLTVWTGACYMLVTKAVQAWMSGSYGSAVGGTLFALPFLAGEAVGIGLFSTVASPLAVAILLAVVLVDAVFYHLLKAPTLMGRRVMDRIEGFKLYLSVAEQARLEALHPPDQTPELFEKYLPYAIALDVENEWGDQFAGLLAQAGQSGEYRPRWYSGHSFHSHDIGGFGSSLGGSFSSAISSSSSAPGSSSGGGGGGSSGGGGGGGGGGGW